MTRLVYRNPDAPRYPEDVARLRAILNARGFDASDGDIATAYAAWSEDYYAAGWMSFFGCNDEDLFKAIREYLVEEGAAQ